MYSWLYWSPICHVCGLSRPAALVARVYILGNGRSIRRKKKFVPSLAGVVFLQSTMSKTRDVLPIGSTTFLRLQQSSDDQSRHDFFFFKPAEDPSSATLVPDLVNQVWPFKGAVSRYSVIFCTLLREQNMATARASVTDISSVSRGNSCTAPAESNNCRFPRPGLVAAIIFPHTKWLPKITDYRDTAALRGAWRDHCFPEPFSWFLHKTSLESLKITAARCFLLKCQRKDSKKAKEHRQFHGVLGRWRTAAIDRTTFHTCQRCRKTAF